MSKQLQLVRLNYDYCNYLRKFDNKVPYNYDKKELRLFVGVLFSIVKLMSFAPLSSPKPKHLKLEAINFSNMLSVTKNNIFKIDLSKDNLIISEKKYTKLLREQIF